MLAILHGWMDQSKATRRAREGLLKQKQIQILSSITNAKRSEPHVYCASNFQLCASRIVQVFFCLSPH